MCIRDRLHTDASDNATGAVLYQRGDNREHRVISYMNRNLKRAEKNYFISDKEILALIYALNKLRYYVYAKQFEIHTNNQTLALLLKFRLVNARMSSWIMMLRLYDSTNKYIKAGSNKIRS